MKNWVALAGALLCAQLSFSIANFLSEVAAEHGKAFITQAGAMAGSKEYENAFGMNWDSVRTFHLMSPLSAPLRLYIETNPANSGLYRQQYRDYVIQSMETWSWALNHRLSYTLTDNPKAADITVRWVNGFDDKYVAGVTTYRVGHADVQIKTVGVPDQDIKANILHEFGHALGIAGHSGNQSDIMVGVRRWHRNGDNYNPGLSTHDVQAIRRLYSATWQRGEDLYAMPAQRTPVVYVPADASRTQTASVQPPSNVSQTNAVLVLNPTQPIAVTGNLESQRAKTAPVLPPRHQ